jgi:hypothetical protein
MKLNNKAAHKSGLKSIMICLVRGGFVRIKAGKNVPATLGDGLA